MRIADHVAWEPVEDTMLVMDLPSGEVLRLLGAAAQGWQAVVDGTPLTEEQAAALAPLLKTGLLEAGLLEAGLLEPDSHEPESQ